MVPIGPRIAFIALLIISPIAFAQEKDSEVPGREIGATQAAQSAAKSSLQYEALASGEQVTYQDILQDPDNLELNYRYARTQVDRGDFLGASATLERILLISPDSTEVRFFYALVLYRLDNLQEAQQQLEQVRHADLPTDIRRQVDDYLHEIRLRRKVTRWSNTLTLGYGYDSNRNAAPSSKTVLFADTPLGLSGSTRKRRDTHFLGVESLSVMHDLGMQAGHAFIASLNSYLGEQTSVDDLDLHSFGFETGAVIKTPLVDFTPTVFFDEILLSRETYLRDEGFRTAWHKPIGSRFALDVLQGWTHEDYSGITESLAAEERSGDLVTVALDAGFMLNSVMKLTGGIGYENKDAKADYNAYEGFSLNASHTWLLPKGQFLLSSLTYTANTYDQADVAISTSTRRDRQLRARAAYGAPATLFLTDHLLPEWVTRDLSTSLSFEQFRSLSTITNYTYRNSKISWMVSKRWEF